MSIAAAVVLGAGCGNTSNERAATLDEFRQRIKLSVRGASRDDGMTAEIRLEPAGGQQQRPCPTFDLEARVNGRAVEVTAGGYRWDLMTGGQSCVFPRLIAELEPDELLAVECNTETADAPTPPPAPQELSIELMDASGSFSASFRRPLPAAIEMRVVAPEDARVRAGDELGVRFDPAPGAIQEVQVAFAPEGGARRPLATLGSGEDGFELLDRELRFAMPEVDPAAGALTLSVTPFTELDVSCDFGECTDAGLFHEGTPISCSVPLEVVP